MRRYLFLLCLLTCFTLSSAHVYALDLGKVHINGFLSQGYLESSGNNFLTSDSTDGTFELFEAGLAFNTRATDKLRIGAQLLARDFGQQGNNKVRLDWGFGDYRWRDWLGLRAGKIKQSLGLYNMERDSDFLRPMVFLPQSIYYEGRRDTVGAALGFSLYGNLPVGAAGDLEYEVFYGEFDIPDDSPILKNIEYRVNSILGSNGQVTDLQFNSDYALSGRLIYNTPLSGLRLSATFSQASGAYDVETLTFFGVPTYSTFQYFFDIERSCTGSIEYVADWFTLASEYNQTEVTVSSAFIPAAISAVSESWYVMVTAPVPSLPELSVSLLYDVYYPDRSDRDGEDPSLAADYLAWQKDLAIGVRYDFNRHWLVKAEWHEVDGAGLVEEFYNPDGIEKDWSYFALKTSFNF